MIKVYGAGLSSEAEQWMQFMQTKEMAEFHFTSRWPYLVGRMPPTDASKFWLDDIDDIARADVLLLHKFDLKETFRGALIEVGAAIALNIPVVIKRQNLPEFSSWQYHPLVTIASRGMLTADLIKIAAR